MNEDDKASAFVALFRNEAIARLTAIDFKHCTDQELIDIAQRTDGRGYKLDCYVRAMWLAFDAAWQLKCLEMDAVVAKLWNDANVSAEQYRQQLLREKKQLRTQRMYDVEERYAADLKQLRQECEALRGQLSEYTAPSVAQEAHAEIVHHEGVTVAPEPEQQAKKPAREFVRRNNVLYYITETTADDVACMNVHNTLEQVRVPISDLYYIGRDRNGVLWTVLAKDHKLLESANSTQYLQ